MKFRKGFVSNSSSSSFICDVCGEEKTGWDWDLSEADMFKCVNGHTVCNEHSKEELGGESYSIPEGSCPLCSFDILMDSDLSLFLLKEFNLNREDVVKEVKESFKDYVSFKKNLK